ncbi:hypothetical protein RCJ22_23395 [Vibrio sp. FNV 38]|nr:hypothetical protein [Vibrio sp. FNV 38]
MLRIFRQFLIVVLTMLSVNATAGVLPSEFGQDFLLSDTPASRLLSVEAPQLPVIPLDITGLDHVDMVDINSEPQDGYLLLDIIDNAYLTNTRRVISCDQVATRGEKPQYFLYVAFNCPDLKAEAWRRQSSIEPNQHWLSLALSNGLRLGGWKDSNLQFRFQQSVRS